MADEKITALDSDETIDVKGWELTGSIPVPYTDGSVWEHRSYQSDFDKDGNYEVVTGRVLLQAAPEPEPEAEQEGE